MSNNKQSSVDKEFVPYEEALALKELGFDELCLGYYTIYRDGEVKLFTSYKGFRNLEAPTFSQAFRWFREKHELDVNIHSIYTVFTCSPNEPPSKVYNVYAFNKHTPTTVGCYNTYEEAELACLRKLIEIANDKQ